MMDYPCGKFGDCSFSRFGYVVQTIPAAPATLVWEINTLKVQKIQNQDPDRDLLKI